MTRTARAVQVPGEPPKVAETATLADTLSESDKATIQTLMEPNAESETDNEIAQLRAQLAQANAEKAQLQAQVSAGQPSNQIIRQIGTGEQAAKLTTAGWIVPDKFGAPAIKVN